MVVKIGCFLEFCCHCCSFAFQKVNKENATFWCIILLACTAEKIWFLSVWNFFLEKNPYRFRAMLCWFEYINGIFKSSFFKCLVNSQNMKAFLATQHENGLNKTFELDNKWTLDWVISFKIHIHSKKISSEQLCKFLTEQWRSEIEGLVLMQFLREEYILAVLKSEIQYIKRKSRYCSYSRKDSWKSFQI